MPAAEVAPSIALHPAASVEAPGSIATLWLSFDAEYMQPIFGGPGSHQRVDANASSDALTELQEAAGSQGNP